MRLGGSGWDAALSHRQVAPRTRLIFDVNATVSMDQFARAPSSRRRAISVCTAVKVSRSMMAWMAFSTRYCGNWPVLRTARPGLPSGVDHRPNKSSNLHCLCTKHHNAKTTGAWDVTIGSDGVETWTSFGDGHTVITTPNGPLGRFTFRHRAVKRTRRVVEHNQRKRGRDQDPDQNRDPGKEPPF